MRRTTRLLTTAALLLTLAGCDTAPPGTDPADAPGPGTGTPAPTPAAPSAATAAVDRYDAALAGGLPDEQRLAVYAERWSAVRRAVAQAGVDHDGAFYAGRGYWHTGFIRGGDWSIDHPGDLDEPFVIDGRGSALIHGDCTQDLTLTGDGVVHILGDLRATLTVRGAAEVVIAGTVHPGARILAGGTLDLYTGGAVAGQVNAAGSGVLLIDGPLLGDVTAGQPVTSLHITGDCAGSIAAPADAAALLTLRVDGYMPQQAFRQTTDSGFTRITASLGRSDADPGLYPAADAQGGRPSSRWVVHQRAAR